MKEILLSAGYNEYEIGVYLQERSEERELSDESHSLGSLISDGSY